MSDTGLFEDCRQLALTCAPELSTAPLYIVDAADLVGLPCDRPDCLGWALDDYLFDHNIGDRLGDRYRGPGPVIALFTDAIRESVSATGDFAQLVANVVVHEVAHIVPRREILEPGNTNEVRQLQLARMTTCWNMADPEPGTADDRHDWRFIRRALHLLVRALEAGRDIPLGGLFNTANHFQSREEFYLAAVLSEALAMRGATFAEIEAVPAPTALMELWESDLNLYRRFRKGIV